MNDTIKKQFFSGIRYNIVGSILYESVKLLHQLLLLSNVSIILYGTIGGIFSTIFLVVHIAGLGAEQSLPAFISTMTWNKKIFLRTIFFYTIFGVSALVTGAFIAIHLVNKFSQDVSGIVIFFVILSEGIRSFLRTLLHTIRIHKFTVISECLVTVVYFLFIWGGYFLGLPITENSIFIPYMYGSFISNFIFMILLFRFYKTLSTNLKKLPEGFGVRVIKARFYSFGVQVVRNLFSGNFVVTFCALRFGVAEAGIFKFASYVADAVRGTTHTIIGFSGGALFGQLKNKPLMIRKLGFSIVSSQVLSILAFVTIFLCINYRVILNHSHLSSNLINEALGVSALFLSITFLEYFTLVYTQFYATEERSGVIFSQKIIEALVALIIFKFVGAFSAYIALLCLVMVKLISFIVLATKSYLECGIVPGIRFSINFFARCVLGSGIFYIFLNLMS